MKITIITLFPNLFTSIFSTSILGRALKKGLVEYELLDLRQFGEGRHQVVDGRPYGGGAGMILRADILAKAWDSIIKTKNTYTILMSASGKTYTQTQAQKLVKHKHIIIVCGHYEGVDQRFIENYVLEEVSIGDYVLTGGEIPAMVVLDSVVRLIPGVLEKPEATALESFSDGLLEYPQYTRPENFRGSKVPGVLLSGNHQEIKKWHSEKSLEKTKKVRPDLLKWV